MALITQDHGRVLISGRHARTFMTESNAARSCALLNELIALGWDVGALVSAAAPVINLGSERLRRQLVASLEAEGVR